MGRLLPVLLAAAALLAGCGGGDDTAKDPASQVPATGGLREKVRDAQAVTAADFPAAAGRTLQQVADSSGSAGPELGMATSVFTPGKNRVAFGMIDPQSGFVYGKTALYVARTPGSKGRTVSTTSPGSGALRWTTCARSGCPTAARPRRRGCTGCCATRG